MCIYDKLEMLTILKIYQKCNICRNKLYAFTCYIYHPIHLSQNIWPFEINYLRHEQHTFAGTASHDRCHPCIN